MQNQFRWNAAGGLFLIVITILLVAFLARPALGTNTALIVTPGGPTPTADWTGAHESSGEIRAEDLAAQLDEALRENAPDQFAGLWLQQQPEFKVMVALTEGGEELLRQYEPGRRLLDANLIEIQAATYTYQDLVTVQEEFIPIVFGLDLRPGYVGYSGVDVMGNQVLVSVVDPEVVRRRLQEAGYEIPGEVTFSRPDGLTYDHVEGGVASFTNDDGRIVTFVRQPLSIGAFVLSQRIRDDALAGQLVIENDCLRFQPEDGSASIVILWPNQSTVEAANGTITIHTITVGTPVSLFLDLVEPAEAEALPGMPIENCPGPYASIDWSSVSQ